MQSRDAELTIRKSNSKKKNEINLVLNHKYVQLHLILFYRNTSKIKNKNSREKANLTVYECYITNCSFFNGIQDISKQNICYCQ